jgi:hypothetical protein
MYSRPLIKGENGARKAGTAEGQKPRRGGKKLQRSRREADDDEKSGDDDGREKAKSNSRRIEMHFLSALKPLFSRVLARQGIVLSNSEGQSKAHRGESRAEMGAGAGGEKKGATRLQIAPSSALVSIVFLSSPFLPAFLSFPSRLAEHYPLKKLTGTCRCSWSPPRIWTRWTACFRRWRERLRRRSQLQAEKREPLSLPPPPPLHRRPPPASASCRASTSWPGTPFSLLFVKAGSTSRALSLQGMLCGNGRVENEGTKDFFFSFSLSRALSRALQESSIVR